MAKPNVWVTKEADGWAVKLEGGPTLSVTSTQAEAITLGRIRAMADKVELIWQGEDGKIQGRNSYGNDPRDVPG